MAHRNPPPKSKQPRKDRYVKLYPILPYTPRSKRFAWSKENKSIVSAPILYHQVKYYKVTFDAGGSTVPSNIDKMTGAGFTHSKSFSDNKNWRTLVAKGQGATYSYTTTGGFVKPIQYRGLSRLRGNNTSYSYGSCIGQVLVDQHDNADLKDLALTRLKNKLNGYIGTAQLAAPLAESREIHRLVRQINGFGMDTLKALLLLKKTHGKSALKQFANIWLAFGFGINPMLKDIESAANAILDYKTRADRRVRVSGSASRDYTTNATAGLSDIAQGVTGYVDVGAHHKQGVRIVAGIDLLIGTSASYGVSDHLGLGIYDIPSAIWELIPYSWAVDYFFTVSPWLDDVFYTLPGQVKYVSQAAKYQNECTHFLRCVPSAGYETFIKSTRGGSKYYSFVRTPLTTLPTRQLRAKSIDVVAKYGVTKLLNLASVLAGHLKTPKV